MSSTLTTSTMIHLKGWSHPLPDWLELALKEGKVKVVTIKDFDYLQGVVVSPFGIEIRFL